MDQSIIIKLFIIMIEQSTFNLDSEQDIKLIENKNNQAKILKGTLKILTFKKVIQMLQSHFNKFNAYAEQTYQMLVKICSSTSLSDKIVRLVGSIIKLVKNFQLSNKTTMFDKFLPQISQLRRILRINRIIHIVKQTVLFVRKKKQQRKNRDYYDMFLKIIMISCDINDILLYLMQLSVLKQRSIAALKKNVLNFYFFQCFLWTSQYIYDLITKKHTNQAELNTRLGNIAKYILDTLVSHNDFSQKVFTINVKNSTVMGFISSVIGLTLIWK